MEENFDVLVIGSGPGGYHAAIRSAQLGEKTAIVDRGPIGGVCVNVGCIPTKALLHVGEVARMAREAEAIGLRIPSIEVDLPGVRAFSERAVRANSGGVQGLLKGNGVTVVQGQANFLARNRVRVTSEGAAERIFVAGAVVIATGAEPISIPSFERDGRLVVDSDDVVALPDLPARLLVLGGGVVGLEFAVIYQRLGSQVTVVERLPELLPGVDGEIAAALRKILIKQGIEVMTGMQASLSSATDKAQVEISAVAGDAGGKPARREFDRVLVAVGRRPVTATLDLEAAGLVADDRGFLTVDVQRQTRVPGIYAIGDVTGGPLLAHKAMREGVVAAEAITGLRGAAYEPRAVPNCIYTDPEIASVGLSEEEASAAGYRVRIGRFPLSASGRSRTMNHTDGLIKLVADAQSDTLLGMHILGPHAESLIGEGVIALEMGATLEDIALSIHPHPTLTEAIHDAAEAAHGKAIHLLNRTRSARQTVEEGDMERP